LASIAAGAMLIASLTVGANVGTMAPQPHHETKAADAPQDPLKPGGGTGTTSFIPAHRQASRVAVLRVAGEIDQITVMSLERRVNAAREQGFDAVVIDIDTYGGRVDSARDIANLLKSDAPVNTVAWVNPNAFSAGTLIALACREIVVHPDATWGDCAPIAVGDLGQLIAMPEAERAKQEAPLLADVVDSARRHHYDERLVQAFIAVGVELWMLEHASNGSRVFVDRQEYVAIFGEEPPESKTRLSPRGGGAVPVQPLVSPFDDMPLNEFSGLSPEAREKKKREMVEFAQTLPPARQPLTASDRDQWTLLGQVDAADQLLVVKATESIDYGLARAVIRDDEELRSFFGAKPIVEGGVVRFDESWSERLVRFLVSFWVRAVLIVIFVISLVIETAAPGFGLFGVLSAVALLLLLGAPYLAGMAQWWEIVLIVLGVGLILAELFVVPGFGVPGVVGVLSLLVGMVGTFVSGDLESPQAQSDLALGVLYTLLAFVGAGVGVWLLSRHVYDLPIFRRAVLSATTASTSTLDEDAAPSLLGAMGLPERVGPCVGDEGVAETDLRPSGRVRLGDRSVDAVTSGEYIPAGARVRVRGVEQFSVVVEVIA